MPPSQIDPALAPAEHEGALRLLPHLHDTDGFYAVAWRRAP